MLEKFGDLPIPMDELMRQVNRTFYENRPLGVDFCTPPEYFPQIGICYARLALEAFQAFGSPDEFVVYEPGPGNGYLTRSFLEEARNHPQFYKSLTYHLIEQSELQIDIQQRHIPRNFEIEGKLIWHESDIVEFPFPEETAVMYIALEIDDDLPTKSLYRHVDEFLEEKIVLKNGEYGNEYGSIDADTQCVLDRFPELTKLIPEHMSIGVPLPIESIRLRERILEFSKHVIMVTTDYGFDMRTARQVMPNWINPLFTAWRQNKRLFDYLKALQKEEWMNLTADVNFTAIALPGIHQGLHTLLIDQNQYLDALGARSIIDTHVSTQDALGRSLTVEKYLKKIAALMDYGYKGWQTLIQSTHPFVYSFSSQDNTNDIVNWLYKLAHSYGFSDIRPQERKGLMR